MILSEKTGMKSKKRASKKCGPQFMKISPRTMSKWRQPSAGLVEGMMSLLGEATSRFEGSSEDIDTTLQFIKDFFYQTFLSLKIPKEGWTPRSNVKAQIDSLKAESKRLQNLEVNLPGALDAVTRKLEQLEEKSERMKYFHESQEDTTQIHPILQDARSN